MMKKNRKKAGFLMAHLLLVFSLIGCTTVETRDEAIENIKDAIKECQAVLRRM